jgi:hypothetical protein
MVAESLYARDGDLFVPSDAAGSPWVKGAQHGSPPSGLLALALEHLFADSGLVPARITVDLFRQIPMEPLRASGTILRSGRRIGVGSASLMVADVELARATGVFLRPSDSLTFGPHPAPPPGPEGLDGVPLVPKAMELGMP